MANAKIGHVTLQVVAGAVQNVVTAFLVDRQSRNLSKNTLEFYHRELNFFTAFLEVQGVTMLEELTPETIRLYLLYLSERRNGGGCHAAYRCIRALLLWAWDEYEYPGRNPITRVEAPRRNTDVLPGVPIDDVAAMVEACKGDRLAHRDRAILLTLLDTGARAGELLAWQVQDFDSVTGALTILHGKGGKSRKVYASKTTRRAILAYLRTRQGLAATSPLFATRDGEAFTIQGLRRMIEKRAKLAGVKAPGLHDFRRAFALAMLRAGCDLTSLQRLLGHSSLAVTGRYLALDQDDLQAAHRRGSPVDQLKKRR